MDGFLGWLPTIYQWRRREATKQQEIVHDWLAVEAMPEKAIRRYPILQDIKGWRNRECYESVRAHDWTASLYT